LRPDASVRSRGLWLLRMVTGMGVVGVVERGVEGLT
jgi:hypothetical protein